LTTPTRRAALAALATWPLAELAAAYEPAHLGQSEAERAAEVPAGPWQGTWRLTREDPRLRTRAAQELATLTVWQDRGSLVATVDWQAGRAVCLDPMAAPCDWVGAQGQAATAAAHAGGLVVVLPVSADERDPYVVTLFGTPARGRSPGLDGVLVSALGDLRYRIRAQRIDPR
jgi:hypothetical protein